jgi:ring-1,2-phenylacetyl-CoA epoxidase subunit PaaC
MAEPVTAAPLDGPTRAALVAYLYAMGDDEMLLGHRDAEWTGLGPILEEDIAFSSMAQDELGHAQVWYEVLHGLGEPPPNEIAFLRDAPEWRNARLYEQPRGDYALSLVRQYLHDLAEAVRYDALRACPHGPVAEAAMKLRQEEKYHLIHGRTYVARLATATAESRERLQAALDTLFPLALGIWEAPEDEARLAAAGYVTPSAQLMQAWLGAVVPFLAEQGLRLAVAADGAGWRPTVAPVAGGRRGEHGPELAALLAAMQGMYRSDPAARW